MKTRNNNIGFTLMELLIVIAIIVVLVAISIPVFRGQITKANETADLAEIRTCYSEQQEAILTNNTSINEAKSAVEALELNYPDNLSIDGSTIIYTARVLKNKGSSKFSWTFETANIE